jgi:hypothetical protein
VVARKETNRRAERAPAQGDAERAQAELDSIDDSIENLDQAPPHPVLIVPRPMACGAMFVSIAGAVVGAAVGLAIGAAVYGFRATFGLFVIAGVLAFAGFVAGAIVGGWAGGVGAKTRDEHRRSYAGRAPGTRPVRRDGQADDKPIGWE